MPEPLSSFYSTALNSRIDSYERLSTRILRQLGCPLINLELARDMCFEYISEAVELYTRYAGYTEEHLLVDTSKTYRRGYGIQMDEIVSTTPELSAPYNVNDPNNTQVGYDYDVLDYRRVVDIQTFEEGQSRGANVLFSVQHAMAQHLGSIFYNFGLFKGFDLVSWYSANEFLELRNKMLANRVYFRFDADNQVLKLTPEPDEGYDYYALISCWVEKRARDCLKNHWVQHYALALAKIGIGNVRGKFGGTQLLGGGAVNYNDLLSQGLKERDELLQEIQTGTGGRANMEIPGFIVM